MPDDDVGNTLFSLLAHGFLGECSLALCIFPPVDTIQFIIDVIHVNVWLASLMTVGLVCFMS